jgi:hypothetical protein
MRLFHVTPDFLSQQMLLNQHRTVHLLLEAISKGARPTGGMARYQNHAGFLAWLHHQCVEELMLRGMEHHSPVAEAYWKVPPMRRQLYIYIPRGRVLLDVADLMRKQASCEAAAKWYDSRSPLANAQQQLSTRMEKDKLRGVVDSWLTE